MPMPFGFAEYLKKFRAVKPRQNCQTFVWYFEGISLAFICGFIPILNQLNVSGHPNCCNKVYIAVLCKYTFCNILRIIIFIIFSRNIICILKIILDFT